MTKHTDCVICGALVSGVTSPLTCDDCWQNGLSRIWESMKYREHIGAIYCYPETYDRWINISNCRLPLSGSNEMPPITEFECKICGNDFYYFDHMVLQQLLHHNCWSIIWPVNNKIVEDKDLDDQNICRADLL